ncbi:MAG: DUF1127 domain-containing protein [Rhodobacteraceae bacterium]|jgi:uncharacterized protein YjiS (DUF1127 family)|uniref:DUF1127 domain-containing protein n=1 Tax=Albidovulum sp. TaxID=1872424 RepID=UPI001DF4C79D|nr:DUF1127 domain-containing protein [uncultured Defluviimonas sp.]MCB2126348.1 DUF1127 domain-containing protein [Paracoccaceae bacterium]MCC0069852.1 DUF1127 domain-containing protein [Paracoccaceae bacterium]
MAYVSGVRGANGGLADRMVDMVRELGEKWRRYGVYRETVRQLNVLSDRDLADLGIHRSEIVSIATDAAYGA